MPSNLNEYSLNHTWVTIGSFDGVHAGHQSLIKRLVEGAHQADQLAVVITFDPHPAVYFRRTAPGSLLTTASERENLLYALGVDQVITLHFDASVANLSPVEFMSEMKEHLGISRLLAGINFALGKNRSGDIATLQTLGKDMDIGIEVVPPLKVDEQIVSSSLIRRMLKNQNLEGANHLLKRPYRLSGEVVHGEARGARLGFPTANMKIPPERLIPANGVYVTRALISNQWYKSVTSIGVRPTFENPLPEPRVEPYILDVKGDFYGQPIQLDFLTFLRPEIKFPDAQSLIEQIKLDVEKAREVLSNDE